MPKLAGFIRDLGNTPEWNNDESVRTILQTVILLTIKNLGGFMKPLCPGIAAELLSSFQSTQTQRSTKDLISYFSPFINGAASKYRAEWNEDIIQEGRIVLITVASSFNKNPSQFLAYALISIRNAMSAFNTSVSKYANMIVDTKLRDGDGQSFYVNLGDGIDRLLSAEIQIDFKHFLAPATLRSFHFSCLEIEAFELFFKNQFQVTEVARQLQISLSKASRLISTAKRKVQKILASHSVKNKN